MNEQDQTFDCPSCGQVIVPEELTGERGTQEATCSKCQAKFTRTFAWYQSEWVFGLWRSVETGKVACSYYKTAFGTDTYDCE